MGGCNLLFVVLATWMAVPVSHLEYNGYVRER